MDTRALLLVLASAVIHAVWNTMLAGARDSRAATNLALLVGTLLLVPPAIVTWEIDADVVPFAIASGTMQVAYVFLLGVAYDHAPLSSVYPVARGSAPVVVLALSFSLDRHPAAIGAVGAVLVGAGILGLRGLGRRGLVYGLAIGVLLGSITTIDQFGVKHASTFSYLLLIVAPAAIVTVVQEIVRGRAGVLRAEVTGRTLVAGVGFMTTYVLILAALRLAPAASVAAVREVSIVIAVVLGALVLREPVTSRR
ncbi:MAG: hypothetical protein FJW96_09800, partial [Actinobacteria bacterium]|nr:hypothetical protein [Actinomycetota bacterium]